MRVRAILNADGGTLRKIDVDDVAGRLVSAFDRADHDIKTEIIRGDQLIDSLNAAGDDPDVDAIVAGGGDGTISAAADVAWRKGKTLGPLPAGTMNLFARAIGLPLDLDAAIAAIAESTPRPVDIATANGRLFLHQFAIGAQARMVQERRQFEHTGRWTKFVASCRAAANVIRRMPAVEAALDVDGNRQAGQYNYVAISNNLYGEGHMPYADDLNGGVLGVYRAERLTRLEALILAKDLMFGAWRESDHLNGTSARRVSLELERTRSSAKATIDGELVDAESPTIFEIHPGALYVLAPPRGSP